LSSPNAIDRAFLFRPRVNTLKPREPRPTVTDTRYAADAKEASMKQSSDHKPRSKIGWPLVTAAAALVGVAAFSQPSLANGHGGGGGGFHGGGFAGGGGFHGGGGF